jgi:hypothetical protein
MKKALVLTFAVLVSGFFFLKSPAKEEKYLNNIKKITTGLALKGPDKSTFRDVLMTMNPKTGEIPKSNVRQVILNQRSRAEEEIDFQWSQVNTEIAGRVRSIMIDPNDGNKLWAGAVTGGLWYNPDFRNNAAWIPVSDNWENMSIACISYDPQNTNVFYVGTGESFTSVNIYRESTSAGVGIYKTIDGGTTWSLLTSTSEFDYVNDIVVRDEDGTSVIYAGVASGIYQGSIFGSSPSDGLFRSADGGTTWTQVLPNISGSTVPYAVSDIELTDSGDLFVGTMRNLEILGGGIILNSSDGINWNVYDGYVDSLIETNGNDVKPGRVRLTSEADNVYAFATGGFVNSFNQIRDNGDLNQIMRFVDNAWVNVEGPIGNWAGLPWHAVAMELDPNNSNRMVVGGLNAYATSNSDGGGLSWAEVSDWSSMYYFSDYLIPYYGLTDVDSIKNHFIHADIHSLVFVPGSSDELITSTDGGLQFASDFSKAFAPFGGERLDSYPSFRHINNSFATTQYYTVALHPEKGRNEILAGSQDNSTHTNETGEITYESMIGGGDGAYCFFDSDDPSLRITSSQSNAYNIWIGDVGNYYGFNSGTFINPAEYDDRSNLLYANLSVDGGFEALNVGITGRYLDELGVLNINQYLAKDMHGLPLFSQIKLGTNSTVAFSALKLSPYDDKLDATMVLGNQLGDVFVVKGLPKNPSSTKIDHDKLPVGYISSIDIGDSNDNILVTFSNYGVESVWYTKDGGDNWENLERNLPDIPVRHGIFNPSDDKKIILATELGVWGIENIFDESSQWVNYNLGLPNVRVDMLKARKSDSVVAIATHGRGVFLGKYTQGGNSAPTVNFTASATAGQAPFEITFDASLSADADGDPLYYNWDFGDEESGTGVTTTHKFRKGGSFLIELTLTDGTSEAKQTMTVNIEAPLGLDDSNNLVYPNPTNGIINFGFDVKFADLFSLSGKLIERLEILDGAADISKYKKGLFIISTTDAKGNKNSIRLLKE